ncbi:PREDICTED: uncharacterized protein LOC105111806 [Populus euphratica]|uniref:Uncharacterized protein LOC105111806 n=1 Tax=Populus euphratica TaxID=75702 RepID=A0AAJ6X4Y3_POPEU|nr:PREDICTED: uncharacterized protein LOC105111806 [Populus euphratica]
MVKCPKFPYHKLKHEGFCDEYEERQGFNTVKSRSWHGFRRVRIRNRFRLKDPSLGRLLRRRVKLVSAVRLSCAKVMKRLKEGQAHFGDLFAGNYLFIQVNPTPLKSFETSYHKNNALDLNSFPPGHSSLPRIAH